MTALAILCGAGVGLGATLMVVGLRPSEAGPLASGWPMLSLVRSWEKANLRIAAGVAVAAVVGLVTRWPAAALLAGLGAVVLPSMLGGRGSRAREIKRLEAIASWTEMLRDTLAGASGLEQAIVTTAGIAPGPIRAETTALAARLEAGEPLPAALEIFGQDMADPTSDLVVVALVTASRSQTRRLGELLGSLASATREQVTLRLRIDAGRARTRTSIRVVIGATVGLVAAISVLNRAYLSPYDSAAGQVVLLAVGALFAGALAWLARMDRPDVPQRLLAPGPLGEREPAR